MPQSTNYATILPLISTPRLSSYVATFRPVQDHEIFGIYIWSQHAAGALYPLLQNLEITLRNSIDREAVRRFGVKWWDSANLGCQTPVRQTRFYEKIIQATGKLNNAWENEQRRLRLPLRPLPVWSHDQIIAATDFSAWQFILKNEFAAPGRSGNQRAGYLWPLSFGRCFRQWGRVSASEPDARRQILNRIRELREYRNRLFHHEPIWVKAANVTDAATAVDTVRIKIRRIEELIEIIDPDVHRIMALTGLFSHALRISSVQELAIYTFSNAHCQLTRRQKRILRGVVTAARSHNLSQTFEYDSRTYTLHSVR